VFLKGGNYSQYLSLPGLFDAGNRNAIYDKSNDFIFIDSESSIINTIPSCYKKTSVGRDFLFEKTVSCKK
jgi:hypothetical protein